MTRLDAAGAWRLIRALDPGSPRTTVLDPDPESGDAEPARLELVPDGGWTSVPEPTDEARDLLDLLLPFRRAPRCVIGQLGQSVDGRIATASGHSHYINGPEDILRLHRLRALSGAVVVGAGTAVADDPRLTVREAPGPNPVRVVLDPRGRVPGDRRVFRDGAAPTLWIRGAGTRAETDGALPAHVRILELPLTEDGIFAPEAVVELLATRGHTHVLVEGGGRTVSSFLAAGALDRLHLSVAPLILGSGRPGISLPPIDHLDEALRPRVRHVRLGRDLVFDLDLRTSGDPAG